MTSQLVADALLMAVWQRGKSPLAVQSSAPLPAGSCVGHTV